MHLKRIRAANFRVFSDGTTAPALDWELSAGLNILVGENDAGKTAVVDAIRYDSWSQVVEWIIHLRTAHRSIRAMVAHQLAGRL